MTRRNSPTNHTAQHRSARGAGDTPALGSVVHWQVHVCRLLPLAQLQVRRLVCFVSGAGTREVGEEVEGEDAVGLGIVDFGTFAHWLKNIVTKDVHTNTRHHLFCVD